MTRIPSDLAEALAHRRLKYPGAVLRAALIDMDGTLYDSMPRHAAAWQRMMAEAGIVTDASEYFLYEGMTGRATIDMLMLKHFGRHTDEKEAAELYHRKTVYFNEMPAAPVMPGAPGMLAELQRLGVVRVLVTGSGQRSLIERLEHDFPGAFSPGLMVTSASVTRGKPHPEPFLKAMELAGVKPQEAVVVENAPLGVEAGARSGAFTIGLTTGPVPPEALAEAGADVVLPSMKALAEQIGTVFASHPHVQ